MQATSQYLNQGAASGCSGEQESVLMNLVLTLHAALLVYEIKKGVVQEGCNVKLQKPAALPLPSIHPQGQKTSYLQQPATQANIY